MKAIMFVLILAYLIGAITTTLGIDTVSPDTVKYLHLGRVWLDVAVMSFLFILYSFYVKR
jgi:hypothetical protein